MAGVRRLAVDGLAPLWMCRVSPLAVRQCRLPVAPRPGHAAREHSVPGRVARPVGRGLAGPSSVAVAHRLGGHLEVALEVGGDVGRRGHGLDGGAHVDEPAVALRRADRERRVAHPQPGMAALLVVGGRAAPVLGQEQRQAVAGAGEVRLRVERPEVRIGLDPVVEPVDEAPRRRPSRRRGRRGDRGSRSPGSSRWRV